MAAEQILDRARKDVMNAGTTVGRRRSFEEDVSRFVSGRSLRAREESLALPSSKNFLLDCIGGQVSGKQAISLRRAHRWGSIIVTHRLSLFSDGLETGPLSDASTSES